MKKYLLILLMSMSLGSYGNSMKVNVTQDELVKLMEKSSIHNHDHHHNHEKCNDKCDREKRKVLLEIRGIVKKINEKMLDRETGDKTIKMIKRHWNEEHPSYQIGL